MHRVSGKWKSGRSLRLAGGAALGFGILGNAVASAQAAKPTLEEVMAKNEALQARIEKLEASQTKQAEQQTKLERDVIDATIKSVAGDADKRSQLMADGVGLTAGYDKGFFIKSEDGSFLFKPSVQFQFRGILNDNEASNETQNGFEVRRARFRFDGNIVSPDLTYSFVWDTNRQGGAVALLDAWAQYRVGKDWAVKVGQFKESWTHEKDVPFTAQLAVERSLVDTILGGNLTDRVQGVSVIYGGGKEKALRAEVSIHDGANSKNTDFRDLIPGATAAAAPAYFADFGLGGRVEYKVFGDWASYRDFTAKGNKENLLIVGAGSDFTQRGDLDTVLATVDAQFETADGWNAYGGVVVNLVDTGAGNRTDWGFIAQAGYVIAPEWEVFGRYDVLLLDDDFTANDLFNEITVGVNYYLGDKGSALHRAKVTVDATYLPDGSPSAQTGIGALAGDEDQFIFRAQFQLVL